MDFAALESRVNAACSKRLSNAIATIGGWDYLGIFERKPAVVLEFGAGVVPTFSGQLAVEITEGEAITIDTTTGTPLFVGTVRRVTAEGDWKMLELEEA